MEKSGLVTKTRDTGYKNRVNVALTDMGRQTFEGAKDAESIELIMSHLPKSEAKREIIRKALEIIRDAAYQQLGLTSRPPFPRPREQDNT